MVMPEGRRMNLYSVDLNLLVALNALMKARNVTRAASAIGLTQPAMSNALKRLRDLFGDPLFVRGKAQLEPTPRAEALAGPLADALARLHDDVLTTRAFEPQTATNLFRVAAHDYEQLVLLPELTRRLAREAPGARLEVMIPRHRLPIDDLARGIVDLAIGIHDEDHPGLYRTALFEERFVCALSKNHALAGRTITLKRFAALEHLLISPFGGMTGTVDAALESSGLSRTVKVAIPQFAVAPLILLDSHYILTLPERVALAFAPFLPITLSRPPLSLPGFVEHAYWHERTQRDPAQRWFRALVKDVASGAGKIAKRPTKRHG